MGNIILPNEETRPIIICGHCKTKQIINIEPFNRDITRLAEFTCKSCNGKIYAGVIILANTRLNGLAQNIQSVVDTVGAKNTLLVGDKGNDTNN